MKTKLLLLLALVLSHASQSFALSTRIGRDIDFPKDYDPSKAQAIRKVIQDERFQFVDGLVSYWPPEISTRLSFSGDAESLNEFFSALRGLRGIGLRVVIYRGRDNELRRDSAWQLGFSHARRDQLTVYLNLNATTLDFDKIKLPDWPPTP
jgi:hypothetical protein